MPFKMIVRRNRKIAVITALTGVFLFVIPGLVEGIQVRVVRPDAVGAIQTNNATSPANAWDDDGATRATITKSGNKDPFSGNSEHGDGDLGTIVGVNLVVDGATSTSFFDDQVRARWIASWSDMGSWHNLPTDGTRDTTSFDVTAERTWSWADLDTLDMVVQHNKQGGSDGSYYLYEIWFEVSYVPIISVEVTLSSFPFGTMPLDNWASPQQTQIINDGTGLADFNAKLSISTAAAHTWSLSSVSNGADTVRAQWSTVGASGPWNNISAYATDFAVKSGVAPSDTVSFWLRILTPTSTGSYVEHASTLTVSAVEG
jgi:hypothetical protein